MTSARGGAVSRDAQDVEYTVRCHYCRAGLSRTRRQTIGLASAVQPSGTVDGHRLGCLGSNRGVEPRAARVELRLPKLAEHLEPTSSATSATLDVFAGVAAEAHGEHPPARNQPSEVLILAVYGLHAVRADTANVDLVVRSGASARPSVG